MYIFSSKQISLLCFYFETKFVTRIVGEQKVIWSWNDHFNKPTIKNSILFFVSMNLNEIAVGKTIKIVLLLHISWKKKFHGTITHPVSIFFRLILFGFSKLSSCNWNAEELSEWFEPQRLNIYIFVDRNTTHSNRIVVMWVKRF